MKKRILIAVDKFKGSISAAQICTILKEAIESQDSKVNIVSCPLADGGDGSIDILSNYIDFKNHLVSTVDPLNRPLNVEYKSNGHEAYIELAHASGIVLLKDEEKNPLLTSTLGTGLQIKDAIHKGIRNINLFLGGSATNDGGIGIAHALGFRFYDANSNELKPVGASLIHVAKIVSPNQKIKNTTIKLWCDVDNIPYGENGAAKIYGKQKGAGLKEIELLDSGIKNLCQQIKLYNGKDVSDLKGGGAAGAVAVCLTGLLNAEITSGINMISKIAELESKVINADVVISGEGRLDTQSLNGKVVAGVATLCQKHNKELILIVGKNELEKEQLITLGVNQVFSIIEVAKNLEDAILNSEIYLHKIASDMSKLIQKI